MKNIYVLPTDKPTRLFTSDSELILTGYPVTTFKTGKHIYIISDEEIKIKDYVINLEDNEIYPSMGYMGNNNWIKKIILTTNQDLINDGVQPIDDEFLEWFIKNPSCDYIHVYNQTTVGYSYDEYHFVFPESGNKEETKQEIPQVGPTEFVTMCENIFGGKPKQETLEEADEKWLNKEFIPSEQALGLTELGFDEPCFGYWSDWAVQEPFLLTCELGKEIESASINRKNILFKAPTFSQAFRFFREKYSLWSMIYPRDGWNYTIDGFDESISCDGKSFHKTEMNHYEEAELECLKKLIDIVKNK